MTTPIMQQPQFYAALGQTVTMRSWLCFASGSGSTLEATNPACSIVGFRFDTVAGDTEWTAYVGTSATVFTETSTGITPDTNFHQFKITPDGTGGWNFYVDGTLVANIPTGSTGLPVSTAQMQWVMEIDSASTTANL